MKSTKHKHPRRPPWIDHGPKIGPSAASLLGGICAGLIAALILFCWWLISLIVHTAQ